MRVHQKKRINSPLQTWSQGTYIIRILLAQIYIEFTSSSEDTIDSKPEILM